MKAFLIHITLFISLCSFGQNLPFYRLVKLTGPNGEAHTNLPNPLYGITSTPYTPDTTGSGGGGVVITPQPTGSLAYSPIPVATGTHYFVNNLYTGSPQNGGINTPFVSMAQVRSAINNGTIKGGDEVHFLRGQEYTMKADFSNFNFTSYLIIGSYGSGADPIFKYDIANNGGVTVPNRQMIYASTCSHILFDSIHFTDPTMAANAHTTDANVGYGLSIAGGDHVFFNHCTFDKIGNGMELHASNSSVVDCSFTDLRMATNTQSYVSNGVTYNADDDEGANGVILSGATDCLIWHCTFKDCYAKSYDYNYDGGAVEWFDDCSRNTILYCTVINCEGFIEAGSHTNALVRNGLIAYNLFINNGRCFWVSHTPGYSFNTTLSNVQFFNNVVVETNSTYRNYYGYLFGQSSSDLAANVFNVRNNAFYTSNTMNMCNGNLNSSGQITHENNAYRMPALSNVFYTVHASENYVGAVQLFTSESGDPATWSYNLPAGSALIDKGAALSVVGSYPTVDYFGNSNLSGAYPDMGMAEYQYQ